EKEGWQPDLLTYGKVIGGGLPVGAYGGRADIMNQVAPAGKVYQAGTLSGNPVAMVAGLATIEALSRPGVYEEMDRKSQHLASGLCKAAEAAGVDTYCTRVGAMSCMFFTAEEVYDWKTASTCDTEMYGRYFHGVLDRGFTIAPSQFEATFVSTAHTDEEIDAYVAAAGEVLKGL
ncbi:MAG: aminotransferase class III-fold pyridoxal phosphate-dependent enzyme, partial [Actinomycetota bacterium]|nr:aminotransferase class III-fold pyridoxal phosphate-dependent enzyme [Actinomycetota bacterium]